ncbi:MAG: FtsX-like permease family protein [Syntrophomonadaceae bacterium]|nr:FtsX-like permease family protein [Syntrophomonadaceae bacterium]
MKVLYNKLWRGIYLNKGQFFAMTLVITIGISLYVAMTTTYANLGHAQQRFYNDNNFADHYFHVVQAPEGIAKQIASIPGIEKVTARIQRDVAVIKSDGTRASARLTSYLLPLDQQVNSVQLEQGRLFEAYPASGGAEALVDPAYLEANQLSFGDSVEIIAEGKQIPLTVVGTAIGPEFVYAIKDLSTMVPDPQTFGIFMIPLNQAQEVFNLPGQVNQILVVFAPGADHEAIVDEIEDLLSPYGNLASYPRKDQISHWLLESELTSGRIMAKFFPIIFLSIAAGIQIVLLRRMIRLQRSQIGIMKGLGLSNAEVLYHYSSYALAVSLLGALAGSALGLLFSYYLNDIYAMFFNLPKVEGYHWQVVLYSFMLAAAVGLAAGLSASAPIVTINPAESMRSQPPAKSGHNILEKLPVFWQRLSPLWKISFRSVLRNRFRSAVTVLGVVAAVSLLLISFFMNDAIDYMMNQFYEKEMLYHYMVRFDKPVKSHELLNISRIEGVNRVEPFLEIPVKIHYQGKMVEDAVSGQASGNLLKKPFDSQGNPMPIPEEGIVLGEITARKLGAEPGDLVTVETAFSIGEPVKTELPVVTINRQLIGSVCYTSLSQANRLLREADAVSGCMLLVDPGQAAHIEARLGDFTGINSILSRQKEIDNISSLIESSVYFVGIMIFFSLILGLAIVYNSIIMSFNERKKELASLLTLGFTHAEVSGLMLKDALIQAVPGLLIGLPTGRWLAIFYISSVSTDMFTFPVIISPFSYGLSLVVGLGFVLLGYWLATRGLSTLDMIEMSKYVD